MTHYHCYASEYHRLSPSQRNLVTHIIIDDGNPPSQYFESKPDDDGDRDPAIENERGFLK